MNIKAAAVATGVVFAPLVLLGLLCLYPLPTIIGTGIFIIGGMWLLVYKQMNS